jgi:hypothetical protein
MSDRSVVQNLMETAMASPPQRPFQSLRESMLCGLSRRFKNEFRSHGDRRHQTSVNRTFFCEDPMNTGSGLSISLLGFQSHSHVNAFDHEDILLQLDLTDRFANQASTGRIDLTRLQRFR